jgi:hypothetical protein
MIPLPSPLPRKRARRRAWIGLTVSLTVAPACSLLVETRDRQCERDADCARFGAARCDLSGHVCVPTHATGDGGCEGDGACYRCAPTTNAELQNACSDATCRPFDRRRLTRLVDGGLPPLPDAATKPSP